MEIGADPLKRGDLGDKSERIQRTKVRVLDYFDNNVIEPAPPIESAHELRKFLNEERIIETIGSTISAYTWSKICLEIHIVDYAWYNVRDRWRDPPVLDIAKQFNIKRRVDDDLCNKAWWDEEGATVGLTRSRATYWVSPERHMKSKSRIGVLLLDPTVQAGVPLWRGRRNCQPVPKPNEYADHPNQNHAEQETIFKDFLYWAYHPEIFRNLVLEPTTDDDQEPIQILLHFICSEWLAILDYIKTRLCQIDLEIVKPESFSTGQDAKATLEGLHMWGRFIPIYREMVAETLRCVFDCSSVKTEANRARRNDGRTTISAFDKEAPGDSWRNRPLSTTHPLTSSSQKSSLGLLRMPRLQRGAISSYEKDLLIIMEQLDEYQQRLDRLTSVVTAVMSIEDSRRGLTDNQNIGRLTVLATGFIPFSLMAGIFSMQEDLGDLLRQGTLQVARKKRAPAFFRPRYKVEHNVLDFILVNGLGSAALDGFLEDHQALAHPPVCSQAQYLISVTRWDAAQTHWVCPYNNALVISLIRRYIYGMINGIATSDQARLATQTIAGLKPSNLIIPQIKGKKT
ncbi:uncharacterized protein F4822DRAFT_428765 [Hypoxylon trugodes]|uniref:uncharacterized protein n=1 Tax=Hypoxylon trugodes TaxID=326681 RepID=UPI0021987D10|nr:uncharacterized protein F4822DRAFT_428765 [Hypoxylon trugodes]KAI1390428.1 hypothetical protein F4822DRAFT_428765 [Hypoxylon trugodes]